MVWLSVLLLAVAVSFDAFAIGITYGINGIAIGGMARFVLSFISGCAVFLAMLLGATLEKWLSPRSADVLGGLILILLGLYSFWRNRRDKKGVLLNLRIPLLGLIIQVFREPLAADYDRSRDISASEAVLLGGALALDAVAAGFAAAILHLPLIPISLSVILASFLFITQGLSTGSKMATAAQKKSSLLWVPGVFLIFMGFLKMLA